MLRDESLALVRRHLLDVFCSILFPVLLPQFYSSTIMHIHSEKNILIKSRKRFKKNDIYVNLIRTFFSQGNMLHCKKKTIQKTNIISRKITFKIDILVGQILNSVDSVPD